MDIPVKPRVLIADDSRIVRAALIKHIEGLFEFREALDGEQAWEALLLDPGIRVVITDLTMPKLDGYGLLQRIRNSRISRIRDIPVVVVSGSDESEERERAKAAGATDLITKGIGTAQLLSRLDILSRLVGSQGEFQRGLEALVSNVAKGDWVTLPSAEVLREQGEKLLAHACRTKRNFVVLTVCVGIQHLGREGVVASPPLAVVDAIGQLLHRTVRQTDVVAMTGEAEFTVVTGSINFDAARCFAERVCRAIAAAQLVKDESMAFIASCGVASLSGEDEHDEQPDLQSMRESAHRRAVLGTNRAMTGVVGGEEELAYTRGEALSPPAGTDAEGSEEAAMPDIATLLQWLKEGRQSEVLPYIGKLSAELQPLVELLQKQAKD
jgi:two-component system, cell cycle response regulator